MPLLPARSPRPAAAVRLLAVPGFGLHAYRDLPSLLAPGDLVVVNDAATLPAALPARAGDVDLEVRLAAPPTAEGTRAVLFGAGDWRQRTEDRPPPPEVAPGERLVFPGGLRAQVVDVSAISPRLVTLAFDRDGEALLSAIYAAGRPVQYAYLDAPLPLWAVQTPLASRPWAVEAPSAAHPLAWETLFALRARGIGVAPLTHAAGLSSSGDPVLDAALPLPERYAIPATTLAVMASARRVIALGTTCVRAIEAWAETGQASGVATRRLGPDSPLRRVDAVVTGVHAPGESHHDLLGAFVDRATLAAALARAVEAGLMTHEFGDAMLVWRGGKM